MLFYLKIDPEVLAAIKPWKKLIDAKGQQIVGQTKVVLLKKPCEWEECNFGNFIADTFVHHYMTYFSGNPGNQLKEPIIALLNAGSLRANLNPGREFILFHFFKYHFIWINTNENNNLKK